ncbi:MAG: hypothetical protein IID37_15175 [Planctomycetes bacterium]|nr:hypothetical protein [Planctomycetota bacterium]
MTDTTVSELILFNDAALRRDAALKGDAFALDRKLKPIYEAVLLPSTETPFSVMISGGWGTGKTSSMAWLDAHLRKNGNGEPGRTNVDTCWFYPWKYQDRQDVWKGLIAEVILASIDFEKVDTAKILKAARQFGKFLGGSFVRVLSSIKLSGDVDVGGAKASAEIDVKEALAGIIEEYGKHVTPQEAYYNVFEKTLEEWITDCYGGDKRLVIFIDDLDRCLPAIALQVLEAIKLYLNIPNLIIIVGVDRQVIDAVVMKHYEDNLGGMAADEIRPKARQYLDKMFQVEVPIAPNNLQVKEYIAERIKETSLWNHLAEAHQKMFEAIIGEIADINPRSVVRALNTAIVGAEAETDELKVAQSMQRALITAVLQKLPESEFGPMYDLCLREQGREFFRRWSRLVVAEPNKPNYLTLEELSELEAPAARVPGQDLTQEEVPTHGRKAARPTDDLAEKVTSEAPNPLLQLAENYPVYPIADKAPPGSHFRRLLTLRTLGLLMRVPFAEEEFAGVEPTAVVKDEDRDWTPLIKLVAERRRVGVDQITVDSLMAETELDLSHSTIPDPVWPLIGALSKLASLNLNGTQVTDAAVGHLTGLAGLQDLSLQNTQVRDAGLAQLKGLAGLQQLWLNHTPVTDAGLAHLKGLAGLRTLGLNDTQVTDAGLAHLKGLAGLQTLWVNDTQVTDAGLAELKKALPNCTVYG